MGSCLFFETWDCHFFNSEWEEVPIVMHPNRKTVFCAFHIVCGYFDLFASILACAVFARLEHFIKLEGAVSMVDFM